LRIAARSVSRDRPFTPGRLTTFVVLTFPPNTWPRHSGFGRGGGVFFAFGGGEAAAVERIGILSPVFPVRFRSVPCKCVQFRPFVEQRGSKKCRKTKGLMVLPDRIELSTSPLPRELNNNIDQSLDTCLPGVPRQSRQMLEKTQDNSVFGYHHMDVFPSDARIVAAGLGHKRADVSHRMRAQVEDVSQHVVGAGKRAQR